MKPGEAKAKTILLVEDEVPLRSAVAEYLVAHGYRVLEASDAAQTRRIAGGEPIHILVTDIDLPDSNGTELAAELRQDQANLAVLFTSGYPPDYCGFKINAGSDFLQKPFLLRTVLARVSKLLAPSK